MKRTYKKLSLALALLLLCTALLSACGGEVETNLLSATLSNNGEKITVKATLDSETLEKYAGETLYLLAVPSAYTDTVKDCTVIDESKVKKQLYFHFPSENEAGESLVGSAFVLATASPDKKYTAVTDPIYIENPETVAVSLKKAPDSSSLKGLASTDPYEASILGAEHILFEVEINGLLLPSYREGALHYVYNGISYYFDGDRIAMLDKQVREASALDLRIYLRTVLRWGEEDDRITALYCPQAQSNKAGYLPNMENAEAAGYIGAFYSFLGSRYSSGKNGLALDYLIGSAVNNLASNCNAGNYSADRALANYLSWTRAAYNTLASYNKNTYVYLSVSNRWNSDDTAHTGNKVFLTSFADLATQSGNFPYRIALDLGNGDDLSSVLSGNGRDFTNIGINNLNDLCDLLSEEAMRYEEKPRTLIIDSLALDHSVSEANRAAYYSYAYYKAAEAGIDALLYSADREDCGLLNASGEKKDFYYAYLMCGSNVTDQLRAYTDKIPSGNLPDFKQYSSRTLTYEQETVTEVGRAVLTNKKPFPVSFLNFSEASSCLVAELGKPTEDGNSTLTMKAAPSSAYAAVSAHEISAADLIEAGYVGVTLSSARSENVTLLLSQAGAHEEARASYVGEAVTSPTKTTYYFNIAPFTDSIKSSDTLTLSICIAPRETLSENAAPSELCIHELALYGSSGNGFGTVLTVLIVMASALAICGLLFVLTQRRNKIRASRDD